MIIAAFIATAIGSFLLGWYCAARAAHDAGLNGKIVLTEPENWPR